ncbi:hypothetical protein GGS23DRAFT_556577 [Durotheca rogersii]|uniref:uncharacterized protein n=1 Tax=Durotheca rogersii TaxID=419775 RepID=UPI00221E8C7A|nr:uncharacterized protein GGS23DRAFT_556577 [Durotheca rogersii]KAI5866322.1 hypothetical protein GGS23DRAFT_556577 [Durotheca rogersii]
MAGEGVIFDSRRGAVIAAAPSPDAKRKMHECCRGRGSDAIRRQRRRVLSLSRRRYRGEGGSDAVHQIAYFLGPSFLFLESRFLLVYLVLATLHWDVCGVVGREGWRIAGAPDATTRVLERRRQRTQRPSGGGVPGVAAAVEVGFSQTNESGQRVERLATCPGRRWLPGETRPVGSDLRAVDGGGGEGTREADFSTSYDAENVVMMMEESEGRGRAQEGLFL